MSTNYYKIEGLGVVKTTRRRNAQRITMRVKPDGEIVVNYPWFTASKDVTKFILDNTAWIKEQKDKHQEQKTVYKPGDTIRLFNASIIIETNRRSELKAYRDEKNEYRIKIPENIEIESQRVQKFILKVIVEACRFEAKNYLPQRVHDLAQKNDFNYQQVFIKNLKSRWGSCSSKGNINLNVHLMRLPSHLIDYIILHELAHTVEANHGSGFWNLLDEISGGNARKYDKEVKNYRLTSL